MEELFTAKLRELERQYQDMRSQIALMQKKDHQKIKKEFQAKKNVCDKTMSLLQEKTKDCRSPAVKALNEAQTAYDMKIRKIMTEDMPRYMSGNDRQEAKVEAKALYAEYSIDFAVQAAQSALLAVLSALDEQMNFEEWRKENE